MIGDKRGNLGKLEKFMIVAPDSEERGGSAAAINGFPFAFAKWIAEWEVFTFNGVFTELFYQAEKAITPKIAKHLTEMRELMRKFRMGRVKVPLDWDAVERGSPPNLSDDESQGT